MGINLGIFIIRWEFEKMGNYLDMVAEAIDYQLSDIEEKYNTIVAETEHEIDTSILVDRFTDEIFETGKDFPKLLLTSFIIAWYSFVEQELVKLCKGLELTITISPGGKTNVEKGIRLSRRFLLESANYLIDDGHWNELVRIGKLRNILVHEGSHFTWSYHKPDGSSVPFEMDIDGKVTVYIQGLSKDRFEYFQYHNIIEQSGPTFEIRPTYEYCKYLIDFGLEFFSKLYSDLYSKIAPTDKK